MGGNARFNHESDNRLAPAVEENGNANAESDRDRDSK
jgi:hypothetical protein